MLSARMLSGSALDSFVTGVELLSLDAGNTIIFIDHARVAVFLAKAGYAASAEDLVRREGEAKRLLEDGLGHRQRWENDALPGAASWGRMLGTMFAQAGVDRARIPSLLAALWIEHMELNLWWLVPPGLGEALDAVRAAGVPVVVVSNSEGLLDELFEKRLHIAQHFDLVVDSGKVGIEKPDPRIWQIALSAYPTPPGKVLHLGDTYSTDIAGALPLGFRAALIDPFSHYEGRHPETPRVTGVIDVAQAIVRTTSRRGPSG